MLVRSLMSSPSIRLKSNQYALYHEHEREVERLESIRELDRDLKVLKG